MPHEPSPQECVAPLGDPVQADGPGGVDNVIGQSVYISLLTFLPDFQRDTNASARQGRSVPIAHQVGHGVLVIKTDAIHVYCVLVS